MDGGVVGSVGLDSKPVGIGTDGRTVEAEEPATEPGTSRLPLPSEAPRDERAELAENGARAVRRRGLRRDRRGGRIRLAAPAAALLFVAFLAASAGALGGERLQGVAGWAQILPPGPGTTDAGGEVRDGQATGRPAGAEAATGHTVDDGLSGVEDAGARRAAVGYYEAVDRESWAYTYGKLDSQSREMFTEPEWQQRNQWFADNEGLELSSMEVDVTGLSESGNHAEVNVRRAFENGVVIDRDTVFVFEEGSWKHRLVGREFFLFMPGATYEEFVEAR